MEGVTLVTGGAGYVGSVVVERLLAAGRGVRVLDSLEHGPGHALVGAWLEGRLDFVRGDVRDAESRARALDGVDRVVHLAAIVGDPACSRDPDAAWSVNHEATLRLLEESRRAGAERFVFASTCSNYGRIGNGDGLATEEWPLNPISVYAETKVAAEQAVVESAAPGFIPSCLRFATVYGPSPRMRFDLTVNEFARDVFLGREVVVYGEQFWRPYVHVRDAARAVCAALDADVSAVRGEVFNVGSSDENYRKLDLVELLLARRPDASVSFVHRDEDPRDYRVGFDKIAARLGFEISRRVPDGIDEVGALVTTGLIPDPFASAYRN